MPKRKLSVIQLSANVVNIFTNEVSNQYPYRIKRARTAANFISCTHAQYTDFTNNSISLPSEMYAIIISFASYRYSLAVVLQLVCKEWRYLTLNFTVALRFETERYKSLYRTHNTPKGTRMPSKNEKLVNFSKSLVEFNNLQVLDCTDSVCLNESVEIVANIVKSNKNSTLTHLYLGGRRISMDGIEELFTASGNLKSSLKVLDLRGTALAGDTSRIVASNCASFSKL